MKDRIVKEFESYRHAVMPQTLAVHQERETRRAFFAGALAMRNMLERDLSEGPNPTMNDLNFLFELEKELADFAEGVSKGME